MPLVGKVYNFLPFDEIGFGHLLKIFYVVNYPNQKVVHFKIMVNYNYELTFYTTRFFYRFTYNLY